MTKKTKKTKKTNCFKKPVISEIKEPVIIITDVYLVKEEGKIKSFFSKLFSFFKRK